MRFGINIPPFASPVQMVELAVRAELNGWDGVFVWDHLHFAREMRLPVHDPWVTLGAIAQATDRVLLGPMVTPLARRRPAVLAKHVVTLDHLSGGRAVLGVGLGHPGDDDFAMFGDDPDPVVRGHRLDEALEVVTRLWTTEPVVHSGAHFQVDAELHPAPIQQPRPRIWTALIGGGRGPRERGLRYEGILPLGPTGPLTPQELQDLVASVDAIGERPLGWDVVAFWGEGSGATEYADAGATWLIEGRFPEGEWFAELAAVAGAPPSQ